jgi:predicted nuclease of restriction endonuclease-like (RecB) superfamily
MNSISFQDSEYKKWLTELKSKIRSVQIKAAIAVNSQLITFYWELGKMISEKIALSNWGDKILEQVSKDLKGEFSEMKGLSRSNLSYAKQFYEFYQSAIVQQPVGQIPWGHNILIFSKSKDVNEAQFYIQQTIENNWS